METTFGIVLTLIIVVLVMGYLIHTLIRPEDY